MKRQFLAIATISMSGAVSAQTFTTSNVVGSGVSASGVSLSASSVNGAFSASGSARFTLSGTTSVANPFDRFDGRTIATRSIAQYSSAFGTPSASTTINGTTTSLSGVANTAGGQTSGAVSALYTLANGQFLDLGASITPFGVLTTGQVAIAAAQAPVVTQSSLGTTAITAGSPLVTGSTATNFIFDFPSFPAGTATVDFSGITGSFDRLNNSLSFASQHKDTVSLVREVWLGGTLIASSASGTTTFAPNAGPGVQSLSLTAGSVMINAADIYATTKNFEVRTKLIGKAFFGNGNTQLGSDYIIGQSSSLVTVQGVPEPATIAGLSLGLLAFARRRKSK